MILLKIRRRIGVMMAISMMMTNSTIYKWLREMMKMMRKGQVI